MVAAQAAVNEPLEDLRHGKLKARACQACLLLVADRASLLYFAAVERHVKERLVGAAVLVAAAIILIPEMLSGPNRAAPGEITSGIAAVQDGETPLKTYTIDLSKSPATLAAERAIDHRASPAETPPVTPESESEPTPAAQTDPEPVAAATAAGSQTDVTPVPAASRPPAAVAPAPRPTAPAPTTVPAPAVAAAGAKGEAWAVQLGSFASRVTAERMVTTLKAGGHDAFVMPVKSGQATLYRVRIGPMRDRESAAQLQRKVQATVPGAAVVAHP